MSDWSKALSSFEGAAENMPTMTGNLGLQLEEPLIFEIGGTVLLCAALVVFCSGFLARRAGT